MKKSRIRKFRPTILQTIQDLEARRAAGDRRVTAADIQEHRKRLVRKD